MRSRTSPFTVPAPKPGRTEIIQMKNLFSNARPFIAAVFLQFALAGFDILSKIALNEGLSCYVFTVYRHAVATLIIAPFAIFLDRYICLSLPVFI